MIFFFKKVKSIFLYPDLFEWERTVRSRTTSMSCVCDNIPFHTHDRYPKLLPAESRCNPRVLLNSFQAVFPSHLAHESRPVCYPWARESLRHLSNPKLSGVLSSSGSPDLIGSWTVACQSLESTRMFACPHLLPLSSFMARFLASSHLKQFWIWSLKTAE